MKNRITLLILTVLCACGAAGAENFCSSSWTNGYTYCASLRLASAQVPTADQTNFPALFCANTSLQPGACNNNADFKTVANGGKVQNATTCCASGGAAPADWIISDCGNGTTAYKWDIESYTASTGALIGFVKIPTLSHSSDTDVCVYFGKSAVSTYQGDYANAWNSSFVLRYGLPNGSSLDLHDSTASADTLTNNASVSAASAEIDGGASFGGANYLSSTSFAASPGSVFTVCAWFNTSNGGAVQDLFTMNRDGSNYMSSVIFNIEDAPVRLELESVDSSGNDQTFIGTTNISNSTWYHGCVVQNGTAAALYQNGAADGTQTMTYNVAAGTGTIGIGADPRGVFFSVTPRYLTGLVDELEVMNTNVAQSWITTSYNEVTSQSSFAVWGTTQSISSAGGTRALGPARILGPGRVQ